MISVWLDTKFCWSMMLLALCLMSCFHGTLLEDLSWSYSGKDSQHWGKHFKSCVEGVQSPINIEDTQVYYDPSLTSFSLEQYESIPGGTSWELVNDGHHLILKIQGKYQLFDAGLGDDTYNPVMMIFRWRGEGLEEYGHAVDGLSSPLEIQLIHYNNLYDSFDAAIGKEDGILVLAMLAKYSKFANPGYNHIIKNMKEIVSPGKSIMIRPLPLLSLMPSNLLTYYRYTAAMSFPPCVGPVVWNVFQHRFQISQAQVKEMSSLLTLKSGRNMSLTNRLRHEGQVVDLKSSDPYNGNIFHSPMFSPFSITAASFLGILIILCIMR